MYLKKIEIQGFKSFADKLNLKFSKGITAIVGPNGSGKSNVADAMRWVLGEQSVKLLRGTKMEDIIFAGTETRKPLGYAQVSIIFDNEDRKISIDYSELVITRRVYRSGESEFYINKSKCRLKDIQLLFMDTGIGKDGYSIIGQGLVEQILSTKPDDRRQLFEEAAGIVKYKSRKQLAGKKLVEEQNNIVRLNDIICEIENQLEPLRKQSETTKHFLEFKNDLKSFELNLYIKEYNKFQEMLLEIETNISTVGTTIKNSKEAFDNVKDYNIETKTHIDEIDLNISCTNEKINNIQINIEKTNNKIENSMGQINYISKDIERIKGEGKDTENKSSEKIKKIDDFKKELNDLIHQIELLKQDIKELSIAREKKYVEINQSKKIIKNYSQDNVNIQNFKTETKINLHNAKESLIQIDANIKNSDSEINNYNDRLLDENQNNMKLNKELELLQSKFAIYKRQLDTSSNNINIYENKVKSLEEKYNFKSNILNQDKSKYSLLKGLNNGYEGYYKSVREIMKQKNKYKHEWEGIHGVIAELIKVPKGYDLAIEVALGSSMQNIVSTNDKDAKKVIKYLKDNTLGRATILPLNLIKSRNSQIRDKDKINMINGVVGFANDLVDYDDQYFNVISNLLGNVIVTNTFDDAVNVKKQVGNKYKIVSLTGEIINSSGAITGGSFNKNQSGILARKRQIKELAETIKQLSSELILDEQTLITTKEELNNLYSEKNQQIQKNENIKNKIDLISKETLELKFLIDYLNEKLTASIKSKEQFEKDKASNLNILEECSSKLNELDTDIGKVDSKLNELNSQNENFEKELNSIDKKLTEFEITLNTLFNKQSTINQNIEWFNKDLEELNNKNEIDTKLIISNRNEIQNLNNNIRDCQDLNIQFNKNLKELTDALNILGENKKNFSNEISDFDRQLEVYMESNNNLEKELNRLQNTKLKYEYQIESQNERIWNDYNLTYNTAKNHFKDLGSTKIIKENIELLKKSIGKLGNINMNAVEEYNATSERYDFLTFQKQDLLSAEKKLNILIQQLTEEMEKMFIEKFSVISIEFDFVFKKLFGGGKGILKLSDKENALESGIEIIAQPPGKRLQNMMLLSGGEKALSAIALLFAIQKMNPSPFCILDEIEAALDDANVKRFANYLCDLAENTQFIIITHRKGTMEVANTLYGITMQEKGISKSVSVEFNDYK